MEKQFSDLIILLASGINQRLMYFDQHPKVQALSQEFQTRLAKLLESNGLEEFRFGVYDGKFIRKGKYLVGPSIAGRSLIRFAEKLQCGGFVFRTPLSSFELVHLFRLAAGLSEKTGGLAESRELLIQNGVQNICLLDPYVQGATDSPENDLEEARRGGPSPAEEVEEDDSLLAEDFIPLLQIYQAMYESVNGNHQAVSNGSRLDLGFAHHQGQELVAVSDRGALDVMQFMRYPDFDSYTIGHSVRVAALASLVGRQLGWSVEARAGLATAGLLHDLGKGKIPSEILFKPDSLDSGERKIMETHPELGTKILLANGETNPVVLSASWGHHIRFDEAGYPRMPKGYRNSVAAALIHVCDVFEALTASRPYKKPLPPRKAYEIMLADEGAFDPRLLTALVRSMGIYPPGSEVRLSDQRQAVVVSVGPDLESPVVRLTHDQFGVALLAGEQRALALAEDSSLGIIEIMAMGVDEESAMLVS